MKDEFLDLPGLGYFKTEYDKEIKTYIKSQGIGLTTEDVQEMIDTSDKGIQISEDNTYEPLDTEV